MEQMSNDGFPRVSEHETPFRLFSYAASEWMELRPEVTQKYEKLKPAKDKAPVLGHPGRLSPAGSSSCPCRLTKAGT